MSVLLPHRTLEATPTLALAGLMVDGVERPDRVEPHLSRIDLSSEREGAWQHIQVDVALSAEDGKLAELMDEGVVPRATLVVYCVPTNLRLGRNLEATGVEGEWATTLELSAEVLRDKVSIYAELAADIDGRPARRIATTDPWDLYVDPAAVPPFEGTFQVKWSHFERDPGIPEQARSESFFIDLGAGVPLIHLNQDMDGLHELLSGGSDRPAMEIALREAEMRRIATAGWVGAIGASIAAIRVDEETGEHELPERGWMADVLRWSLPSIYPDVPSDEALVRIRKEYLGPQAPVVQAMVQLTMSRHMQAGKVLQAALKAIGAAT